MWSVSGSDMVVIVVRRCESCRVFPRPPACLMRPHPAIPGAVKTTDQQRPWKPGDYIASPFEISLPSAGARERRDPGVHGKMPTR